MTREEAIEIVKTQYSHDHVMKTALGMLIPELRESEDEGIRRKMIEHFKSKTKETWCNMPVKSILDWLEKQQEQKPKNILTDDDSLQTAYLKGQTDVLEDPEAYGLQKEPAEWSEEDNATIKSAVHWLEKYLSTIRAKDVSSATQDGILTVKTTIANLKSLRSSWKPSEEQMTALRDVITMKRAGNEFAETRLREIYEQLKKL